MALHLPFAAPQLSPFAALALAVHNDNVLSIDVLFIRNDRALDEFLDLILGNLHQTRQHLSSQQNLINRIAYAKTLPAKNNIPQSRVRHLNPSLPPKVNGNMLRVSLHLPESDHKVMVTLVANGGVRREIDVIMDSDDVVEEIAAGEREVLKDEVDVIVCILDTRDRDIADLHQHEQHLTSQQRKTYLIHNHGKIIFLISFHKSGLNFNLPSLSNNKSLVNRAQFSPNCSFVGSSPIHLNQSPTD
jgi:hypothetical protein